MEKHLETLYLWRDILNLTLHVLLSQTFAIFHKGFKYTLLFCYMKIRCKHALIVLFLFTYYLEKSFVKFLLPLVRHVFFCVIKIVCTVVSIEGRVS